MQTLIPTLLVLVALLTTGCAGKPFAHHDDSQIPQGPGLVSGEDGVFRFDISDIGRAFENRQQNP